MQAYQLGYRTTTAAQPLNGGKAYFYLSSTTTLTNVYEDAALTTPLANPVIADSAGFFPELVYLDPTKTYRMILKTSADVTISDADPINTAQSAGGVDGATINADSIPGEALEPTAIEDRLGFTPQESFAAMTAHERNSVLDRIGEVFPYFGTSAPSGALLINGGTIGDASSGASSLAHAEASDLFALLWAWDPADSAILDDAGAASTRGASAAADFALHKRLTLPDVRGEFIRGLDLSRGIDALRGVGSAQAGQYPQHNHTAGFTRGGARFDASADALVPANTGGLSTFTGGNSGGTDNSSENRPRNVAFTICVRY